MASAMPSSNVGSNESKDFSGHNSITKSIHLDENTTKDGALRQIRTSSAVSMPPEVFEKFYLSPQNKASGDLRKTFGNPAPLGSYYFMGGLLNGSLGSFWLSFAWTLTPASFAFFLLAMGVLSFFFAVGALRTYVCLAIIEWSLGIATVAGKCLIAAGAFGFVSAASGWWISATQILASIDFPSAISVTSSRAPARSSRSQKAVAV